jgi:hypothetical protein
MDSRYRPTVPQRKKIQSLEDELLRGPLVGDFAGDDVADAAGGGESAGEETHDSAAADTEAPAPAAAAVKAEAGGVAERKSGGFARAEAQSDARLRAIAEQVPRPPRPKSGRCRCSGMCAMRCACDGESRRAGTSS